MRFYLHFVTMPNECISVLCSNVICIHFQMPSRFVLFLLSRLVSSLKCLKWDAINSSAITAVLTFHQVASLHFWFGIIFHFHSNCIKISNSWRRLDEKTIKAAWNKATAVILTPLIFLSCICTIILSFFFSFVRLVCSARICSTFHFILKMFAFRAIKTDNCSFISRQRPLAYRGKNAAEQRINGKESAHAML